MVLVHNVTLHPETKVLVWISSENVKAVAEQGHKLIHAASDYFYLVSTSHTSSPNGLLTIVPGLRSRWLGR